MPLFARIFFGYFLLVALLGYAFLKIISTEVKPSIRQSSEEVMVETANVLASLVSLNLDDEKISSQVIEQLFNELDQRQLNASIWGIEKNEFTFRIYITDDKGMVIYDSANSDVGADFSRWNDVYLTLKGKYGARTTKTDQNDKFSSVMYVAAAIKKNEEIVGVLTVAKPTISMEPIAQQALKKIQKNGLLMIALTLVLGFLMAILLSRSLRKLRHYAERVSRGDRAKLPKFYDKQFSALAQSVDDMRIALEGKHYVENYVHNLTHELKAPITAIEASAQLLNEEMQLKDRKRFIANIITQNQRLKQIIEKVLMLAKVENLNSIESFEKVVISDLLDDILSANHSQLNQKSLQIDKVVDSKTVIHADKFLLRQAINNVVDNAIKYSPLGSTIKMGVENNDSQVDIVVSDQGTGIPEYAINKIFDRFYSHSKSSDDSKSTGLGLNFTREILKLHHGSIDISNLTDGGCQVKLSLPMNPHTKHT